MMNDTLNACELHCLWLLVPERRRLSFLGSLSDEACQLLLAFQLSQRRAAEQHEPPSRDATVYNPSGRAA